MDKKSTALARMRELNVEIKEKERCTDFTLLASRGRADAIEFGFLLAQLSDHEYPYGFESIGSSPDSQVYGKPMRDYFPPVRFVESYPHGLKYRIYKKDVLRCSQGFHLQEREEIIRGLKEVVGAEFEKWFITPVASLGGQTPKEMIALPNGGEALRRLMFAIKHGIPN